MVRGKSAPEGESARRFEVLLEQIRSEVHVVAEGHSLLAKELRETRTTLASRLDFLERATTEGFGKVWGEIRQLRETQQQTNTRLDQTNTRFDQTNARLDYTNAQLGQLVARFDTHDRAHAG